MGPCPAFPLDPHAVKITTAVEVLTMRRYRTPPPFGNDEERVTGGRRAAGGEGVSLLVLVVLQTLLYKLELGKRSAKWGFSCVSSGGENKKDGLPAEAGLGPR